MRRQRVQAAFQRMDLDQSGGIDKYELQKALISMGIESSDEMVASLFLEADVNRDSMIDFEEFYRVMSTLILRQEAAFLQEEINLQDEASREKVVVVRALTFDEVMTAVSGLPLVGGGKNATEALDALRKDGALNKWGSAKFRMREYSSERMIRVTGIDEPEEKLGMRPSGLVFERIKIVQFAGITALLSFLFGGLLPAPLNAYVSKYGQVAFAVNLLLPIFSLQIDSALMNYEYDQKADSLDRWCTREAGRFLAAYLCGVPIELLSYEDKRRPKVLPYSKQTGNIDFAMIRSNSSANAFEAALAFGLTPKEVQYQAVIQTAGLMAEYSRFGDASQGYLLLQELDRQLTYAQTFVDPFMKTQLARFGIIESKGLIKAHASLMETLAEEIKGGAQADKLIALIEAHVEQGLAVEEPGEEEAAAV